MKHLPRLLLAIALALALVPLGLAAAQDDEPAPCAGDAVSGTVVAVDAETGLVTIDTGEDGLCTVHIAPGDYSHPIVALLGQYFDQVNAEALADALETTQVWVVCDAAGECELAGADDEDAVPAQVVGVTENEDGSFTLEFLLEDEDDPLALDTEDDALAGELGEALETLAVDWELGEGEDGPVVLDAGDQIAQMHADGLGFGVIVKLYAMAAESQEACAEAGSDEGDEAPAGDEEPCGVTVEELAEAFQSGTGMGQLFQEYGRPAMLGVGHVRQALRAGETEEGAAALGGPAARNGCRNSNGRNPHCADPADTAEPTGGEPEEGENATRPGNGGDNRPGNGNGGGNGPGNGGGNRPGNGGGNGPGNGGGHGPGNNPGNGGGNGPGNGNGGGDRPGRP